MKQRWKNECQHMEETVLVPNNTSVPSLTQTLQTSNLTDPNENQHFTPDCLVFRHLSNFHSLLLAMSSNPPPPPLLLQNSAAN